MTTAVISLDSSPIVTTTPPKEESRLVRIAKTIFERISESPLFWAKWIGAISIGVIVTGFIFLNPSAALGITLLVIGILWVTWHNLSDKTKNRLTVEFRLAWILLSSTLISTCANYPWYSEITPEITLGGIPLKTRDHHVTFKELGHGAVLSMVEAHETLPCLWGEPMTPEDWEIHGTTFHNCPSIDWTPVLPDAVDAAVEFMHKQISAGKKIYVHCLAGVGRSATVVICYLIKHKQMAAQDAAAFVRSKRFITVHAGSPSIVAFAERHKAVLA